MKIPFDIKYRPQIESGEYKVETRDGRTVRIVCWDAKGLCPIIYLLSPIGFGGDSVERPCQCTSEGKYCNRATCQNEDLFLITPEPELSAFEKAIKDLVLAIDEGELRELGVFEKENLGAWAIKKAAELLNLARKQFIKDGYIIEKKAFHDAVKNVSPEVMKEVSKNVDNKELTDCLHIRDKFVKAVYDCAWRKVTTKPEGESEQEYAERHANNLLSIMHDCIEDWLDSESEKISRKAYKKGKEEALKDLPRWRVELGDMEYVGYGIIGGGIASVENPRVYLNGHSIDLYSLRKLPGFKEDESHE